ncbi:MAG: hypothetical protein J6U67_06880 [Lachnospiraceae bacterium]|nr:hypothetical protein [Lachnospiraceae bacterium]
MFIKIKKIITKLSVLVAGVVLAGYIDPIDAYAGSFTHVHTSACYKSVQKTCSHYLIGGKEYPTNHCPRCGTMRECSLYSTLEVCRSGIHGTSYRGCKISCNTCGYTLQDDGSFSPGSPTYTVTECACGIGEGSEAATVSVSASESGWTNGPVGISCNVSVSDPTFSVTGISFSGGGGDSAEVSENGTYSFTVTGSNGQSVTESVTVSNIDKTAPSLSLSKNTDAWTEGAITISASASDDASGIQGYSFNGGGIGGASSWEVTSNGTYSVTVTDNAGNTSTSSITVSNIGRDPQVIERERREAEERQRAEEEKRKAEEEKKKAEEEAKRKASEDAKKKDEKAGEKNKNDQGRDTGSKDDKKKDRDSKKEETVIADISENSVSGNDVSLNDISGGDISLNDVSGNLISVNDKTPKDTDTKRIVKTTVPVETAPAAKVSGIRALLGSPAGFMMMGILLLLIALILLTTFSYVYTTENGKLKPVSPVRLVTDKKKMFVRVPAEKLKKDTKYRIFYSPFGRLLKKGRDIVVDVDGSRSPFVADDGLSFVYNG